ncbi:CDP-diacylglycerol--glycerol-3-phosphate-3-phosphatidyltransferase [Mycoplasma haemofelis Ohio2]|uniref:CDP-diacylglycerol--glycerol-3-phosphate 3-phosphatidyltransferase n=1 Tax=Mycoplasma haemofelis (strain Ohio2) TaxID=859194 RepID=F6FJS8_MYCHI|nr:CDP-diacylglycerol--glycerol-3-phosphate-3-phosphatidyltransferase [Mycoplasma haemofelis Ohio2]
MLTSIRFPLSALTILFFLIDSPVQVSIGGSFTLFHLLGGFCFVVSVFTDFLDGYLARKWDAVSGFGKIFDPLADKLLINGTMLVFWWRGYILSVLTWTLISRDILMDLIRLVFYKKRKIIAAIKTAKYKTATEMLGLVVLIFCFPKTNTTLSLSSLVTGSFWGSQGLLFIATIFSLMSFWQYIEKLREKADG